MHYPGNGKSYNYALVSQGNILAKKMCNTRVEGEMNNIFFFNSKEDKKEENKNRQIENKCMIAILNQSLFRCKWFRYSQVENKIC